MEISSSLNHKTWQPISCIPRTRLHTTRSLKLNTISCQAQGLSMSMQRDSTNLYQVLSLDSENVGFDEIKKAYRSLALQYHPDLYPSARKEESTNKFVELQKAYEILSDPISRRRYDGQLSMAMGASLGFHKERVCTGAGEMNTGLSSRMVWENQLYELQKRSSERMERKKNRCM